MNTLDLVKQHGGEPADFLDIGGGANAERVRNALEMVLLDPKVRGVFINIFGGITRGDEVARGIIAARDQLHITKPLVVRMTGTMEEEGRGSSRRPASCPGRRHRGRRGHRRAHREAGMNCARTRREGHELRGHGVGTPLPSRPSLSPGGQPRLRDGPASVHALPPLGSSIATLRPRSTA